ncbi:MAG: hypothetical protein CMK74_14675 [Pseudomonadales bacterium]|nr:hypothetical protein [Pseudomonadales bacterium]
MSDLKPCPFCGSEADLVVIPAAGSGHGQPEIRYIACTYSGCKASGGSHPLEVAVVAKWNRRVLSVNAET